MRAPETAARLAGFEQRGPGSDSERRAAVWLARELESKRRTTEIEPFWCRPNWALAHAWHVALALLGSLLSVSSPRVGGALLVVALVSMVSDALFGISLGRRLTPERASQNVVSSPLPPAPTSAPTPTSAPGTRLIITANYDAARTGLVYREPLRRAAAALRSATGGLAPGWLAYLVILIAWLLAIAILRLDGQRGSTVGVAQLPPTVGLVLALALLLELASAGYGPSAGDNASGVAAAIAIARALDTAPPRHVAIDLVLQGAGEGGGVGLRKYLRARRRELKPRNVVVLGIAPCAAGRPSWWISDGQLVPLRYFARLRELCERLSRDEAHFDATPHRGRGATPALHARAARLPAIAIGCLDERGLAPRSHQSTDRAAEIDPDALDRTVEFALMLVDAIDGYVGRMPQTRQPTVTPA